MAEEKKKLVKVRALAMLAGEPYLLPYDTGVEFEIDELQAAHLVEVGRAEYVSSKRSKADKADAAEILEAAKKEAEKIVKDAGEVAEKEALAIVDKAKAEAAEILEAAKKEVEALKVAPAPDANPAPAPETATDKKAESAEKR